MRTRSPQPWSSSTGIRIVASDSRLQSTNRQLAITRLLDEIERRRVERRHESIAAVSKSRRQKAKRSRGTERKLVESKRRRGETKKCAGKLRMSFARGAQGSNRIDRRGAAQTRRK
jgi:hypothetical protein